MARESFRQIRHKSPKFKDSHDESLPWEEKLEIQKNRKRKKPKRERNDDY